MLNSGKRCSACNAAKRSLIYSDIKVFWYCLRCDFAHRPPWSRRPPSAMGRDV